MAARRSAQRQGMGPHPSIPDADKGKENGLVFRITQWQCHKCRFKNPIVHKIKPFEAIDTTKKCSNTEQCSHAKCKACYNLNPKGVIFEHCDGSAIGQMEYLLWCLEDMQNEPVENESL